MSIQRRHLKSLGLVIDSDVIHPKVKADLVLIYDTLSKDLKRDKHFKEDREDDFPRVDEE